jgi:starvation-inducible DNA-binding protein
LKASPTLAGNLQAVLTDLIELHLQGKQAHWNIVGRNFRDLHLQLDEIITDARLFSDETAERMRALHAISDGRSSTVSSGTSLPEFPAGLVETTDAVDLVVERLNATVATMRRVHDEVDEEDPTSADLLHGFIKKLEQYAWMVGAENMKASGDA